MHHHRVGQTLDNWALRLSETLLGVSAGGMRQVAGVLLLDRDVILKGDRDGQLDGHHKQAMVLTVREMSETTTSEDDHRPKSLISGWSRSATGAG